MLAARNPFMGHPDLGFQTPPRVISEIKKPTPVWPRDNIRPRITGELLCYSPLDGRWRPRRVAVRSGQIQLGGLGGPGDPSPRLALRRLNLTAGPCVHSFALRRSPEAPPILTLQASNQHEFDLWVKTIAIELIRQTPLDAIKYLDILTLTPQLPSKQAIQQDCNQNCLPEPIEHKPKTCRSLNYDNLDENRNYCQALKSEDEIDGVASLPTIISPTIEPNVSKSPKPQSEGNDEQTVELLLKRCQNADSYVPVKEKLQLFESLCRLERLMSTDDSTTNACKYSAKRTRSLHDLSHSEFPAIGNSGVKQICKYFETKNVETVTKDACKYNSIARGNRTSFGPVKTMISRKYSVHTTKNCSNC